MRSARRSGEEVNGSIFEVFILDQQELLDPMFRRKNVVATSFLSMRY